MTFFSNSDATLDSRVIIKRIADIEEALADVANGLADADELDELDNEEFIALTDLRDQCDRFPDWNKGLTLINDDYFEEYAREIAEDLHDDIDGWPLDHVDWAAAAEALKQDYRSVTFDGQIFWVRS